MEYWTKHSKARPSLERWMKMTKGSQWKNFTEVRRTFGSADRAKVYSGRMVVIFNISGNDYRLITAIHYNVEKAYILCFLTHAEYSKNTWKDEL